MLSNTLNLISLNVSIHYFYKCTTFNETFCLHQQKKTVRTTKALYWLKYRQNDATV